MSLDEAGRQLEAAIHDARVSFDCIALGELERAHTNAITARAAVDAAEYAIRVEVERLRQEGESPVATDDVTPGPVEAPSPEGQVE
ncbi:hypothetical protein LG943_04405 [Streptomonospora sp. S1-112]|uniref:Uncharacterized protein n=1 Tax=Streptomonospora mangrovi TaxID=2883123 RepID=A0A9X3SLQ0_9ACTN|nr:hypothetical protein [Streptomonospora mangrovi]MDA0563576.1 hypothetical protein [Streptomonospora mangrovi]